MLTMGKVAASATLGATAYLVAGQVMAAWPEDYAFGAFRWVSLGLGLWSGWTFVGRRVTRRSSLAEAIGYGLTGMVMLLLLGFFVFAGNEALRKALDRRYHGPIEAILDMLPISARWGANLMHPDIIATLLLGGVLSGLLARLVDRIWR